MVSDKWSQRRADAAKENEWLHCGFECTFRDARSVEVVGRLEVRLETMQTWVPGPNAREQVQEGQHILIAAACAVALDREEMDMVASAGDVEP